MDDRDEEIQEYVVKPYEEYDEERSIEDLDDEFFLDWR